MNQTGYNERMIKGITLINAVRTEDAFERMRGLFAALGFEPGKGWEDGDGKGAAFLAPVGNLELVLGALPGVPRVMVEVTQIDAVHATVREWVGDSGLDLTAVRGTHWQSRMFSVELGEAPGSSSQSLAGSSQVPAGSSLTYAGSSLTLGFWESENAVHGRPVAVEGDLSAVGMRFAIVTARWNAVITDRLLQGSLDGLKRSGTATADIEIVRVPGAWEIPSAARTLAETKRFDAVLTLGCLLRGETAHYEAIYTEVARGIGQSQQETGVPHAFGVLTCETLEQALDRAGVKAGNKGFEAAIAAIEMVSIQRKLKTGSAAAGSGLKGETRGGGETRGAEESAPVRVEV